MKKLLLAIGFVFLGGAPRAVAQVSPVPHTFTPNTVIRSSEVNANFTEIFSKALNRTGGTMTGTLTVQAITVAAHNTYDLGATATRFRDGFFAGTLNAAAIAASAAGTIGTTLTVGDVGAAALDVAGGIQAGSGNVGIVDTSGRIPAISSTFFASVSGANLTAIPETAITDGSILARLAATEQVTGAWTFSPLSPTTGNTVFWKGHNAAAFAVHLAGLDGSNITLFGPSDADIGAGCCNGTVLRGPSITIRTNSGGTPVDRTTIDAAGTLTHTAAFVLSGDISPATLAAGNNNDYNPTGLGTTYMLRLTPDATNSTLTGLAAQSDGHGRAVCNVRTPGSSISLTIAQNDVNSSAANRFSSGAVLNGGQCVTLWYDSTSSIWRLTGEAT